MIQPQTYLTVADNSGGRKIMCIRILGNRKRFGEVGDIIIGVQGRRVSNLEDMFRKVWSQGDAGSHVSLDILPYGSDSLDIKKVVIRSRDRYGWLRMNTN